MPFSTDPEALRAYERKWTGQVDTGGGLHIAGDLSAAGGIAITNNISQTQEDSDKAIRQCQNTILRDLRFKGIDERLAGIAEAHADTFEWVFQSSCDFVPFLRSGSGTYWITGKPGSGKSTLMKFLYAEPSYQGIDSISAGQCASRRIFLP